MRRIRAVGVMARAGTKGGTVESVLSRVSRDEIVAEPFPHVVIRDALDEALCERLIQDFPPLELITGGESYGSNQRFDYWAAKVLRESRVDPLWRGVIATHVSQGFLDEALALFAEPIREIYPSFERDFGALDSLRAGIRRRETFEEADVLLDAQISINTPVTGPATSVRRGHLDAHNKLFVGLLYLRHPEDGSKGGELELYRYATARPRFEGSPKWTAIGDEQLELVTTVPYEKNLLVFFLNSPSALHGVTPRSPTATPRLFMNLVAEVPRPLFDVPLASAPRRRTRPERRRLPATLPRRVSLRPGRARWRVVTPSVMAAGLLAAWLAKALAHHDYDLI